MVLAVLIGALIGGASGWWYALPPTEWLNFTELRASYKHGAKEISLLGRYEVIRQCTLDDAVIWRTEAIASDGQLAVYGPKPGLPPLERGQHSYISSIPLLQRILPDGWVVRIIATCPGEKPETVVSPAAVVLVWEGRAPTE